MKYHLLIIVAIFTITVGAKASIVINFEFEALRDSSGIAVSNGTVFALIASNSSGSLPSATDLLGAELSTGFDISNGSRIFAVGQTTSAVSAPGNAAGSLNDLGGDNYSSVSDTRLGAAPIGSIWGLYWFPSISTTGTTIAGGDVYGFFQSSNVDTGQPIGDTAMILQGDGNPASVAYYDLPTLNTFAGPPTANTPSVSDFSANFTVIPEPSAAILGLLGAGALLMRRRR